ncbi:MAG: NADP-dependent malic enzyme [Gammaproteobacteria bacterium]|jgi:malate dehydrogenase (oxaloacetate-decarboxylating)|nr:NADP-dependent malic enzyme [Gammaproteobacteria bacterium]
MKIPEILLIETDHRPATLARVLEVVDAAGLTVEGLDAVGSDREKTVWELTLIFDQRVDEDLLRRIGELANVAVVGRSDRVFNRHRGGKIEVVSRAPVSSVQELRDIYTPGVARVCLALRDEPELARDYTHRANTVAIVTNGTAVLGLGNLGPLASLPVMEGKAALFHQLVGISGVPILLDETDPDRVVEIVAALAPSFGAIQIEDIAAPACFPIEEALSRRLDIPVLHDDQDGTAVVTLAALLSATRRVGLDLESCTVGQIGLGAAGIGIVRLLIAYGVGDLLGTDPHPAALERLEGLGGRRSSLEGLMANSDIVVAATGVRGLIRPELVRPGQLILALSNPDPEIEPEVALAHGAGYATDGKSVNNLLGFPGLFRGALDVGAREITEGMLFAAAETLSRLAPEGHLVPDPLDREVHRAVAEAVRREALSAADPAA